RDPVIAREGLARARRAVQVRLDADHSFGLIEELAGHRADTAADLENPGADERPHQVEDVRLIIPRLAHRLEVVGGVALLGLGGAVVDVHPRRPCGCVKVPYAIVLSPRCVPSGPALPWPRRCFSPARSSSRRRSPMPSSTAVPPMSRS